jgi:hypothetical protein
MKMQGTLQEKLLVHRRVWMTCTSFLDFQLNISNLLRPTSNLIYTSSKTLLHQGPKHAEVSNVVIEDEKVVDSSNEIGWKMETFQVKR